MLLHDPIPVVGDIFNGSSRLGPKGSNYWMETLTIPIPLVSGVCNGWLDDQAAVAVPTSMEKA